MGAAKTKRPIYTKWWFYGIVALLLIGAIRGDQDYDQSKEDEAKSQKIESVSHVDDVESFLDLFIERFNNISAMPIENIEELDIRESDYRVEYRLQSFDNAVGKKGRVGTATIEIVNFGALKNENIRVYVVTDSKESAFEISRCLIHILEPSITDDEITEEFGDLEYGCRFVKPNGYIDAFYANGGIAGYNVMFEGSVEALGKQ